jgi:hypothetical protein
MSIIYTCIVKNKNSVLSEFTEFTGNFAQISMKILEKVSSSENYSIEYDR